MVATAIGNWPHAAAQAAILEQERQDWERNAEFYLREVRSPLYALLNDLKVRTYGLDQERRRLRVLDFGGGTGFFSQQLASWGHIPITLDLAAKMLQLGQQAYHLSLPLQASSPPLPFADQSLDAVVANGVLHHCKAQDNLVETLREIHRVLKPGGLFLVYDRNGAFLGRHLHHAVLSVKAALEGKQCFSGSSSSHEPDFDDADMRAIVECGFRIERRRYVSTLFTFLTIVACNTLEYLGRQNMSDLLRVILAPLALLLEAALPVRSFTVEQCVRLVRDGD